MGDCGQGRPPIQRHHCVYCEGGALISLSGDSVFEVAALVARAAALAAIVVTTGAVAFRFGVLQRWRTARPEAFPSWTALVSRSGAWAAVCLLLVEPVRLYTQARGLVMPGDPVTPMMQNVLRTTWGHGWLLQVAAACVILAGFFLAYRRTAAGWWLGGVSVLAVTLSPALMGHAVAMERLLALSVAADWIHVAAAGAWLGSLAMIALIARSPSARGVDAPVATLIELFYPVALTCGVALVTTGVVSLFLRVDHVADLLHSTYGAILAVKLAFALGVAVVGFHHSRHGARLARLGETPRVARSLAFETMLAAFVIAATAALVGTAPPMQM